MQQAPFLPVELYGVIGWPLGQSLSPLIHNTAFQTLGRAAVYMRWEIAPERLAAFVDSFRCCACAAVRSPSRTRSPSCRIWTRSASRPALWARSTPSPGGMTACAARIPT